MQGAGTRVDPMTAASVCAHARGGRSKEGRWGEDVFAGVFNKTFTKFGAL